MHTISPIALRSALNKLLFISISCFLMCSCEHHLIKDRKYRNEISGSFQKQQELASHRQNELFGLLSGNLSLEEKEALEFLYAYLPLSDLADYDGNYYLSQVRASLEARKDIPWVKNLPEDIFLHYVLPVRVNNENLDTFRTAMYKEIRERVRGLNMREAALEINHWCHKKVNYRGSDGRTSSPLATMKTSFGRCGEESVFTVAALRTAGIPARQVYTPRWAHTDDNHAWVEVWIDGSWYFMGACEPEPDLNMGWFAEPSRRCMLVHTRSFGKYSGDEQVLHAMPGFSELNLISHYAPSKTITIIVTDTTGNPVPEARVDYGLYNYCEFYPLTTNSTDTLGQSFFTTGLGDLLVWASKGNAYGFSKVAVQSTDSLRISITTNHPEAYSLQLDLVPPVQPEHRPVIADGQEQNKIRFQREDSIRNSYISTFKDSAWAKGLALRLHLDPDSTQSVILRSHGNWNEIAGFLEKNTPDHSAWVLGFLYSISDKDLRDCPAEVLSDHLLAGLKSKGDLRNTDAGFFTNYILSPRIELEGLRAWRAFLQNKFMGQFKLDAQQDISILVNWTRDSIRIDEGNNLFSRCALTPQGVYELRVSDARSRNIFFVALCRSLEIPARINPVNGVPQYFRNNRWNDVLFEPITKSKPAKGYILFKNATAGMDPRYYLNFTLGHLENGVFRTLELEEGKGISGFKEKTEVDAGSYRLVTGNRITGGAVLSELSFFDVKAGETVVVPVKVRSAEAQIRNLGKLNLSGITAAAGGSSALCKAPLKGSVLIWMDPGSEPAKHILYDLAPFKKQFDSWGGSFFFLLPEDKVTVPINNQFKDLPITSITSSDKEYMLLSELEKICKQELKSRLPVVIVCTSAGEVIYLSQGYVIGIGEQLESVIMTIN
ncbi:MAG: transglutaminase domain-containing protein [Bacteroidales bacterium]